MGTADIQGGRLVELYHRYVGEPESMRDVYGYWIFLAGCLAVFAGVGLYLVAELALSGNWTARQYAIASAAIGGVVGLFGILVLLPVRRRFMYLSLGGVAISLVSMWLFWLYYPQNFNVDGPTDYAPEIVAVYSAGVGVMIGVAALVPIVTGEKGLLVEPEIGIGDDSAPIMVGDETRDALFAVFETDRNEWSWRVIKRDAVGEAVDKLPSDTDARMAIEDMRGKIADAGLLELTTAAFRLYRTENNDWRWSLVREDGSVLAESGDQLGTRDEAESTVNFLKEATPSANVVEIRDAAFDVERDERGRWHWRLLDDDRRPLATDPDGYANESDAESGTRAFADGLGDVRMLDVESIAIELVGEDRGEWRWRVVDSEDRTLVSSDDYFDSRRDAEEAAYATAKRITDATVIERGTPGFELYEVDDEWRWRLRDDADDLIAESRLAAASEDGARSIAERVRDSVGDAEAVQFRGADYEVYPADGEWHWRLVAEDRRLLADSTVPQESMEDARAAADRVREQALAADLIEFEKAAFQQYESGGEWRWRLIDEDGQVMADSGEEYASRDEVMDGMTTLKEHAPDADVLEIETAAFEIYQTNEGNYAWRLIDETGKLVAEGTESHPTRAAARDAVDFLLEHLDGADVRTMERAIFQLGSDENSEWHWWLVDTEGSILAEGTETHPTRDDAKAAIGDVRAAGDGADIDTLGELSVRLRRGNGWHWEFVDRDREPVATGERTYDTREGALSDVRVLTQDAADAPVFQLGDGVLWVDRSEQGWGWTLIDGDRESVAESPERYETHEAVVDAVEAVQTLAPDAGLLESNTMSFDLYRDEEDDWRWRLIDEQEQVRAVSAAGYEQREAVERSIEEARDIVGMASILEIDEAAFEFHQERGGWIWRLVDENGEPMAESVEPHETRSDAREQMLAVKNHAPSGETVVTW